MLIRTRGGLVQYRDSNNTLSMVTGPTVQQGLDTAVLSAGMNVTSDTARSLPAVTAAVRVAAEAIANLDLGVWTGDPTDRVQVPNAWQAKLFANPNDQQTPFDFRQTIEESLTYRGNAFLWKLKDPRTGRVVGLYALHPDQVRVFYPPKPQGRGNVEFYVGVVAGMVDPMEKGYAFYRVGRETITILRGFGSGGQVLAPSPVTLFKQQLGVGLAKMNHEASLYSRGTSSKLAITFPGNLTQEQADRWRKLFEEAYSGPANANKALIVGGGASIHPIGLTLEDAQYIESVQFDVDQISRIFNVQASLIGGGIQGRGSASPLTPEHEQDRWLRYGVLPRMRRIENALVSDPDLFPTGSPYYPMFDANNFLRGDLQTEAQIAVTKVQAGIWTINEARAMEGRPPVPGGDVPQLTPVGGAPNPDSVHMDNTKN